ncbi:MAG: sodium:glutamate symporter [Kiritimatiellae bacterium]|nr:sodium:glutamate symporter [Kiritimatiellia bacterium]
MTAVIIFAALSILLISGKILRVQIPLLQRLYLPSSIVGGLLGLLIISCFREHIPVNITNEMRNMPGFLINIIFATLFLGGGVPKVKNLAASVIPQLTLAQIVVWGQFVVGVGLAGFLLAPMFNVPAAFGNLLEMGFEGGHGTVGGMQEAFKAHNWTDGIALGYTVATIGMVTGIVVGMALVNWAYSRGYIKTVRPFSKRSLNERRGIHTKGERPSAGKQTVLADSVDSLAWHIAIIGIAVLIGYGILEGLRALEIAFLPDAKTRLFKGFPIFPLCMLGGVLLQLFAKMINVDLLVDKEQMNRISGAALDYLALAAVATIELSVVAANWVPLAIMTVAGAVWCVCSVMYFSPRLFKEAWFERGIAEFGQASGVTATGLLLLRTVDPDNKTIAAASFAGKQLLHEPGMNIWVALSFALVFTVGWMPVFLVSLVMLIIWVVVAVILMRRVKKNA